MCLPKSTNIADNFDFRPFVDLLPMAYDNLFQSLDLMFMCFIVIYHPQNIV